MRALVERGARSLWVVLCQPAHGTAVPACHLLNIASVSLFAAPKYTYLVKPTPRALQHADRKHHAVYHVRLLLLSTAAPCA